MTSRRGSDGDDSGISSLVRRSLKEVVARWAVRHRAPRPSWLRPQDEAVHPWDGRRHFAEEYIFAAAQRDLGILVRLEWLPGRESHRLWVILFEEGAVYTLPGSGQAIVRGGEGGNWRVGGLELDCVEPFQRWRIGFRGKLDRRSRDGEPVVVESASGAKAVDRADVRLDLTFLADHPPYIPGTDDDPELLSRSLGGATWDADFVRGLRRKQMRSYVQVGELAGTVVVGDRILAVDSACLREHGWGVRDWGASDQALHCFVSRGGRPHVWIHRADFPWLTLEGGFVAGDDGLRPIADLGVTLERRPEQAPRRIGVDIELRGDQRREDVAFDGECRSQIALEMDGRGRLYLAFLRVGEGDAGIWIGQRRTLPRPESR